jgi:hypothetical protein
LARAGDAVGTDQEATMSKFRSGLDQPNRRDLIVGGTALVGAAALPAVGTVAAEAALAPAADLLAAVRKFLDTLEPDKQKAATFAWDGREWRGWNYFGIGGYIKPGLRLEQMNEAQKEAAWGLLATVWSPAGVAKARNVMLLQDILAESGNGAGRRSSQRFSLAVFGTPAETGAWGLRCEGHHLTQSVAVRDNRIVSVTPFSFSALPNRVKSGRHAGLNTLKDEESLARRLFGDLSPRLQGRARIGDTTPYNILSYAGRERANARKVGLPVSALGSAQRDLLWQLIETYSVEHLPAALTVAQRTRVRIGDREAVHFAWYGPNTPERAFGYRLIGDNFVIEMASVDPEAQHLHTVYNDLGNVLGRVA